MVIKETRVARALRRLVLCVVFICRKQSSVEKLRKEGCRAFVRGVGVGRQQQQKLPVDGGGGELGCAQRGQKSSSSAWLRPLRG